MVDRAKGKPLLCFLMAEDDPDDRLLLVKATTVTGLGLARRITGNRAGHRVRNA